MANVEGKCECPVTEAEGGRACLEKKESAKMMKLNYLKKNNSFKFDHVVIVDDFNKQFYWSIS